LQSEAQGNEQAGVATQLNLIAQMRQVSRPILQQIMARMPCGHIKLHQNNGRLHFIYQGGQSYPFLADISHQAQGRWKRTNGGWTAALGLSPARDSLIATIPQILALLHLKHSYLINIQSGPWFHFPEALPLVDPKLRSKKEVRRGVKLLACPNGGRHNGDPITVVVLFPSESAWAKEPILWA